MGRSVVGEKLGAPSVWFCCRGVRAGFEPCCACGFTAEGYEQSVRFGSILPK
jgi:hypothetical protein